MNNEAILPKDSVYRNSLGSSRQPKALLIKKRALSRKRSSVTANNSKINLGNKDDSTCSFASSMSSDNEYEDDDSKIIEFYENTSQPQIGHITHKRVIRRKIGLAPPNPLIKKRELEQELTYSGYKHKIHNENVKLEFQELQKCNEELQNPEVDPEVKPLKSDNIVSDNNDSKPEGETSIRHFYYLEYRTK